MYSENAIRDYLKPAAWKRIVPWLLFALMLASFVMGFLPRGEAETQEALPFHPLDSEVGSYAYIDVVEVSDWLYNYDGSIYYTAADANGYFYTVRLYTKQHDDMEAQQAYWERASDDVPMPAPYRLYGLVQSATANIRESVASSWDISESEYEDYFGTLFLNATSSPREEGVAIWRLAAWFLFLFWLILAAMYGGPQLAMRRCLKRLDELGELDAAAAELTAPETLTLAKDSIRLSESFVFNKQTGAAVRYADILWCYRRVQRVNFIAVGESVIVRTAAVKELVIASAGACEAVMARVYEKNPAALFGFSRENAKACKERVRDIRAGR